MRDFSFLTPIVWCILITEAAERFAYFGFRAVLVLYFKEALQYDEAIAISFSSYTICFAYLSPLLGAGLADGAWGRYRTILIFGWVYAAGLAILTTSAYLDTMSLSMQRGLTFLGLSLVCLGTGGIKPCVSAFGADQVAHADALKKRTSLEQTAHISDDYVRTSPPSQHDATGQSEKVRAFFAAFYFCINLGAVLSFVIVPEVRARWGFGAAFLCPTIFLLFAMGAFLSKRNQYVHTQVPSSASSEGSSSLTTTFVLCWWLIRQRLVAVRWVGAFCPWLRPKRAPIPGLGDPDSNHGDEVNDDAHKLQHNDDKCDDVVQQQLSDAKQTLHVLPVMLMFPIFWMLYDQQGSVWTLQATRMKLGPHIQPEQLNVVNPLEIMLFIPLFDRIVYPVLEQRGFNLGPLRRMGFGMFLGSVAFFVSGFLETAIETNEENSISVFWQLPQITLITIGEIFLSVTGMEFSYSTSPERMKALLMSLYLLMTAIGNFLGGTLYASVFATLNRAVVMHVCAVLLLINMVLFSCVAKAWERREEAKRAAAADSSCGTDGVELLGNQHRAVVASADDISNISNTVDLRLT